MISRPIAREANPISKNIAVFSFFVGWIAMCCLAQPSLAQISEYTDCSEYDYNSQDDSGPLTTDEKVARLDNIYYPKIADISKCENRTEGDMSSTSNAGSSGAGAQGGSGGASSTGSGESSSISTNEINAGETSVGMTNTMYPVADLNSGSASGSGSPNEIDDLTIGKEHDELDAADNVAALRAQIKAQIEVETDPEIKAELRKQYEALK